MDLRKVAVRTFVVLVCFFLAYMTIVLTFLFLILRSDGGFGD